MARPFSLGEPYHLHFLRAAIYDHGGYQHNRIPVTKQELDNLGLDSAALTTLCLKQVYAGDWPQRTGRGCAL